MMPVACTEVKNEDKKLTVTMALSGWEEWTVMREEVFPRCEEEYGVS